MSARELRQRRSNYRCCIPALAGFVSPQSIAPDGGKSFVQDHNRATMTRERDENDEIRNSGDETSLFGIPDLVINSLFAVRVPSFSPPSALTALAAFGCIEDVKWLALCMLLALECSCTTIANRRDLYSPQPSPELDWHRQTTTTTTTRTEETLPPPPNR